MRRPLPLLLAALLLPACQAPELVEPQPVAAEEYPAVFDAAVQVLRDRGFEVDRQDYRFGRITTHPADSPTIAEPWWGHNTTAQQMFASTLNHLRRVVHVSLDPAESEPADDAPEDDRYALSVRVELERYQAPVRRLTGTATRQTFSHLDTVPAELAARDIPARYWRSVGRDPHLEARLLNEIQQSAVSY